MRTLELDAARFHKMLMSVPRSSVVGPLSNNGWIYQGSDGPYRVIRVHRQPGIQWLVDFWRAQWDNHIWENTNG